MTTLAPAPTENLDELLDGEVVCLNKCAPATHMASHAACHFTVCDGCAGAIRRALAKPDTRLYCTLCGARRIDPKTITIRPI